jgi:large subunit ribosomal protein L18
MLTDTNRKKQSRKKRHRSLRKRVEGTAERPRLAVFRSTRHIYAQVIDDLQQKTLAGTSDLALDGGQKGKKGQKGQHGQEGEKAAKAPAGEKDNEKDKKVVAKKVGAAIAKKCLEKGIDKVVFDRAGFKYHGRISALADGAREAGLKF